jgi:hypothetical protein
MEPPAREDAGENVPRGGDALAVLAANADCEIYFCKLRHLVIGTTLLGEASLGKFKRRHIFSN